MNSNSLYIDVIGFLDTLEKSACYGPGNLEQAIQMYQDIYDREMEKPLRENHVREAYACLALMTNNVPGLDRSELQEAVNYFKENYADKYPSIIISLEDTYLLLTKPKVFLDAKSAQGAEARYCNASGVNFSGLDLRNVKLTYLNLSDANMSNALLSEKDLIGICLQGADLQGADLTGARLGGANLQNVNFTNAKMDRVDLTDANITKANFNSASVTDWKIKGVVGAEKAIFTNLKEDAPDASARKQVKGSSKSDPGPRSNKKLFGFFKKPGDKVAAPTPPNTPTSSGPKKGNNSPD